MKVVVTGASGMVGKGVLLECLDHPDVEEVLSVGRKSLSMTHPKLKELLHTDFSDFRPAQAELTGYDACFHCMGVSAAGMSEENYIQMTWGFSMALARIFLAANPGSKFTYVSGQGTDSTEKGRVMWARVKGKTENDLLAMAFSRAYMFRPGAIIPLRGITPSSKLYRFFIMNFRWLLYFIRWVSPRSVVTTTQVGKAMIHVVRDGYHKNIMDPADIQQLAG